MSETLSSQSPDGVHPETGLYDVSVMPLADDPDMRRVQEQRLNGEEIAFGDKLRYAGRDEVVRELDGQPLRPDHAYRAVSHDALESYHAHGAVVGQGESDEYEPGNNKGVDWYLGGAALKYGGVLLEVPADPAFFRPAGDQGVGMTKDPEVRHMKSSGTLNPIPMSRIKVLRF